MVGDESSDADRWELLMAMSSLCQWKSAFTVVDFSHEGSEGLYIDVYKVCIAT